MVRSQEEGCGHSQLSVFSEGFESLTFCTGGSANLSDTAGVDDKRSSCSSEGGSAEKDGALYWLTIASMIDAESRKRITYGRSSREIG